MGIKSKKFFALIISLALCVSICSVPVSANAYSSSGKLVFGLQEHINADKTKTPEYIADAVSTMGADAFRLSYNVGLLFSVSKDNKPGFKSEGLSVLKNMVAQLKQRGITDILYVTDSFLLTSGYAQLVDGYPNAHGCTVPDPKTEPETYKQWLELNATAFKMIAEAAPEIKFFEPFNEPNVVSTHLEKKGISWGAAGDHSAYKYTAREKAGIMADLCWYISEAVKSVDPNNQVTTPSVSTNTNDKNVEGAFIDELYRCIESGNYPTAQATGDTTVDDYFTIVNIHCYSHYSESILPDKKDFVNWNKALYDVVKAHNDGDSRVWMTETGYSDYGGSRNEKFVAINMKAVLKAIDRKLPFIDTVFIYMLSNASEENDLSEGETNYGLFYSGDDTENAYKAKPIAKAVYSYFNGNTTDYYALDALAARWATGSAEDGIPAVGLNKPRTFISYLRTLIDQKISEIASKLFYC